MVRKRAVRKQQDTSHPLAQLILAGDAFNAAVTQCVADANEEAVHRVRTGSRRLQAMLEAALREGGAPAKALQEPARAWLRQLKRTRQAAGSVRDLDVHRKLLERWLGESAASPLRAQAEQLDHVIKSERKHRAHDMQKQIRKRQLPLLELQNAVRGAMNDISGGSRHAARPTDAVALDAFVRATDSMPLLDAENLHDFRKATKKARYVAEAGAVGEKYSSVAKALKRIQDTIGDWHDWLCLAREAREQDAPELTAALDREVERHLSLAMKTTETMRALLLGEWMALGPRGKRPPKGVPIATGARVAHSAD